MYFGQDQWSPSVDTCVNMLFQTAESGKQAANTLMSSALSPTAEGVSMASRPSVMGRGSCQILHSLNKVGMPNVCWTAGPLDFAATLSAFFFFCVSANLCWFTTEKKSGHFPAC